MINLEKILLLVIVVICALISVTIVAAVIGDDFVIDIVQAAGDILQQTENNLINDNSGAIVLDDEWQIYRNEGYAFEIAYPSNISPKDVPDQNSLNAGIEVSADAPVWEFRLDDPALFEGTNLVDASLVIHISRGETAIAACSEYKPGSHFHSSGQSLPVVDVNGIAFWKDVVEEGVMGGKYQQINYRTISQGACYELTQLIQSKNLEAMPPDTVQPFDDQEIIQKLDQVLGTFTFLDIQATFPEMTYPDQKTIDGAVDKSSSGNVDGIDVSHWQGDIRWWQVGDAGYVFAFVKGTEGVGWTDSRFFINMDSGPNSGVIRGAYHFARPDLGNTGKEEAEYFLSVVGDYLESGHLRPVLDLEVRGSMGKTALSNWVLDWMQTVENQTGIAPLLYTNLFYINSYLTEAVTEYDLWIAYWNCDPTVTYTIPPTGKWRDWAFWQYCVAGAGTVPGISTPIDLDIFNGVEDSLIEYDAASPLWVSLTSDAYQAPKPYYADLTADVNGDATGLINYHYWWDCDSLEVDINNVETSCGVLPQPSPGECLNDAVGMRCNAVANEVQLAEHTYLEIGDITAKVIVERGAEAPAEDRYQISIINPLKGISADPESPGIGTVYEDYAVTVDVVVKPSVSGVVQVDIIEEGSITPLTSACQTVEGDVQSTEVFDLTIPWSLKGMTFYDVWTRYRSDSICPVTDTNTDDLFLSYAIEWPLIEFDRIGLYDPETNKFYLKPDNITGWDGVNIFKFEPAGEGWLPISGDWDGDGVDTVGLYDPATSNWYLKSENVAGGDGMNIFKYGPPGGGRLPISGDWDGDGVDTVGFYDPTTSYWYLKPENVGGGDGVIKFKYGPALGGRLPFSGDWDGDGVDTVGLYGPTTSRFFLKPESVNGGDGVIKFYYGPAGGGRLPISGDWDGDGVDTVGLYDPATSYWYLKPEPTNGGDGVIKFKYGPAGGGRKPTIGKW